MAPKHYFGCQYCRPIIHTSNDLMKLRFCYVRGPSWQTSWIEKCQASDQWPPDWNFIETYISWIEAIKWLQTIIATFMKNVGFWYRLWAESWISPKYHESYFGRLEMHVVREIPIMGIGQFNWTWWQGMWNHFSHNQRFVCRILLQMANNANLLYYPCCCTEQVFEQTGDSSVTWDALTPMWQQNNDVSIYSRTRNSAVLLVRPPSFCRLCKQKCGNFIRISNR